MARPSSFVMSAGTQRVSDSADNKMVRLRSCLFTLLLCALLPAPAAAAPATFAGISGDGETVFFTTPDKLVPGDTDTRVDVYERSYDPALERYVTRAISTGPVGGNDAYPAFFAGVSADGSKAFFATQEALVVADKDLKEDVYVRDLSENTTALVSDGDPGCAAQGCGDGNQDATFAPGGIAAGGNRAFFHTTEQLSPLDEDASSDVYVRDLVANTTTLVSAGAAACAAEGCGKGAFHGDFRGASADGTKAFFITQEKLAPGDTDSLLDIYRRDLSTATTVQVSVPGTCPGALDCSPTYRGVSPSGSHAYFETNEQLAAGDEDSSQDVYDWSGGAVALVSTGPAGGNDDKVAVFAGASADSSRVFFETVEKLVAADGDSSGDVYERAGGTTALVSTGPDGTDAPVPASLLWISPDGSGSSVLFLTAEALVAGDEDDVQDVYARAGGTTTLLSIGPVGGNAEIPVSYAGASDDGSRVFVETEEKLVGTDTDSGTDVYELSGGTATLVSTGPLAGKVSTPSFLPEGAVSEDGAHAFFITDERITEGDLDAETDVYDRFAGGTLLASIGNSAPLGPPTPAQLTTDPASTGTSLTPRVKGQSDPNTGIKLYVTPDCSGAPVATGTSVELGGSGIQVTVAPGSTSTFRATATDTNGDTSPCSAPVSYTHQSSPPPPPPPPPPPGEEGGEGGGGTGSGSGSGSGGSGGSGGGKGGTVFVAPHTRITFGPAGKTRVRRPVFRFTDSTGQPGTTFRCKVDRGRWQSCRSPLKLKRLKLGSHLFQVKATNAVGTGEQKPVKRRFRVVAR